MQSSLQTVVMVSVFALGYLYFTARKTARQQLDIYDFVMLSAVAIVPFVFVAFPGVAERVAGFTGVAFPFVIMFGVLIAVLFIFIHRLTEKIHRLESDNRLLIQEVSLLRDCHHQEKQRNRQESTQETSSER